MNILEALKILDNEHAIRRKAWDNKLLLITKSMLGTGEIFYYEDLIADDWEVIDINNVNEDITID